MPKRICPFEEDLAPQMKVHVGQKEVNNGVQKDIQMKKVYDRTLNLLMTGAKELSRQMNHSNENESIGLNLSDTVPVRISADLKPNPRQSLKQMFLNNKLQLEVRKENIKNVPIGICGCCRSIDDRNSHNCSYCEKILCSYCLVQCHKCSEYFCQSCLMVTYDTEEQNVCLNCYG